MEARPAVNDQDQDEEAKGRREKQEGRKEVSARKDGKRSKRHISIYTYTQCKCMQDR